MGGREDDTSRPPYVFYVGRRGARGRRRARDREDSDTVIKVRRRSSPPVRWGDLVGSRLHSDRMMQDGHAVRMRGPALASAARPGPAAKDDAERARRGPWGGDPRQGRARAPRRSGVFHHLDHRRPRAEGVTSKRRGGFTPCRTGVGLTHRRNSTCRRRDGINPRVALRVDVAPPAAAVPALSPCLEKMTSTCYRTLHLPAGDGMGSPGRARARRGEGRHRAGRGRNRVGKARADFHWTARRGCGQMARVVGGTRATGAGTMEVTPKTTPRSKASSCAARERSSGD